MNRPFQNSYPIGIIPRQIQKSISYRRFSRIQGEKGAASPQLSTQRASNNASTSTTSSFSFGHASSNDLQSARPSADPQSFSFSREARPTVPVQGFASSHNSFFFSSSPCASPFFFYPSQFLLCLISLSARRHQLSRLAKPRI